MVVGSTIVYIILYFRSTHSRMEREKMREMFVSLLGSADKQGQHFFLGNQRANFLHGN